MRRLLHISFLLLLLPLIGCNRTPDYLLDREDMIALLIDIHKGEAVSEIKSGSFNNDSLKNKLKHSIYRKHGVTQEQFDTIMLWYGSNIEEYRDIYIEIIKRLEAEEKSVIAKAAKSGKSIIEVGDSVNLWVGTPVYTFVPNSSNNIMRFDVKSDDTFEKGDRFDFSFRIFNNRIPANMFMAIEYTDGATSYISKVIESEAKHSIKLQADSTRILERIYGYLRYDASGDNTVFVDSINIARERLFKREYSKIRLQKTIDPKKAINKDTEKDK